MAMFHFLRPEWLWLLALLPLFYSAVHYFRHHQSNWETVCDQHLLPHLLVKTGRQRSILFWLLFTIAWIIACLAMAGPTWDKIELPTVERQAGRVIVFDLSTAMLAKDISPDRLTRARFKMKDILQRYHEGQLGMVAFAKQAYVVSPLTNDAKTIEAMLEDMHPAIMPEQGENIAAGLEKAKLLLEQAGFSRGDILLVTASAVQAEDFSMAKQLVADGYHLSVLAMASKTGAPIPEQSGLLRSQKTVMSKLDEKGLQELARLGDGRFITFSPTNQDIKQWFDQITVRQAAAKQVEQKTQQWQDQGRWLLVLLLPLVLLVFRRGWLEEICR